MGIGLKVGGLIAALGTAVLFSAGTAEAAHKHRERPTPHFGLAFHAPFDFYTRYAIRGQHYPRGVSVYEPRRYTHPRFGHRYWHRY